MISAAAESELRAITQLARGCEKSHGHKQVAALFGALADRMEALADEYGESAWRRRVNREEER